MALSVQSRPFAAIVLALLAAVSYAGVPNFARLAFLNGVPALETVFYRTTALAIILGVFAGLRRESFALPRAAVIPFLLQCLATLLVSACYLASLQYLPVTLSVVIFYTFPVIVLVAAPIIEGHVPHWSRFAVAGLGFLGLYIAIGPAFEHINALGVALAALGSLGCALQFFSGRLLAQHLQPAAFGSLVHIAILPFILALALYFGGGSLALVSSAGVGPYAMGAVVLVCLCYLGGYFCHMSSVKAAPASIVAPFFNLEPVLSTTIAVLLLKETMTQAQWTGGAIVLASLLIASILPTRTKS
jgi:drug/metabolite transporter (DMT)-like permease